MRSTTSATKATASGVDWSAVNGSLEGIDLGDEKLGIAKASPRRKAMVYVCLTVCWVPLVAQGLVPAWLSFSNPEQRSWFLARRVPEAWQWPVVASMVLLGLALLVIGRAQLGLARRQSAAAARREPAAPPPAVEAGAGVGDRQH